MYFHMKTIFITGVAGLIGGSCAEYLLQKGLRVVGTDAVPIAINHDNFTFEQCSLADEDKMMAIIRQQGIDCFVHLGCSVDNDFHAIITDDEIDFSRKVDKYIYKAAIRAGAKSIILLSTHQMYAVRKNSREPIREDIDEKPVTNYAKLKSASELTLAKDISGVHGVNPVIMRTCPVYTNDFVDNLKMKVFDKDDTVYVYGYGGSVFSFTCVYNIADFICAVAGRDDCYGIYNVCDTKPVSANEIIEFFRTKQHMSISAVGKRNYKSDMLKSVAASLSGAAKSDYRYNDLSIACSNISYDNTRARQIAAFRWTIDNVK